MGIPQWKRAGLIVEELKRLDEDGKPIEDYRSEIQNTVIGQYQWCHSCLLLAVYGLYKNGYIGNTPRTKSPSIDFAGFSGRDSLDIHHAFDALNLLKEDPDLSGRKLKQRLGGEQSIYSFVLYYFHEGLLR